MPRHSPWVAAATLGESDAVGSNLDTNEGGDVEDEPFDLRRREVGVLEDAVFPGSAEGAAGSHFGPHSRTGLLVLTVSNRLNQINQLRGTGLINQI